MRMAWRHGLVTVMLALLAAASLARAETAAFDLAGPRVEVKVTRAGKALPISQVPNLRPGDRLWVHPLLPTEQSVRYLLIVAFLRGPTNPPPEDWFTKAQTWTKKVREEGILVAVPQDAQQALLFLAPETGGDFATLRTAVRGKPGSFVRAAQDLYRVSLDRSRLDKYISAVEEPAYSDPQALHERSVLLARSLNIKLDRQCFDKPSEQQVPCLTQNTDQLVLDDAHSQSMVATLTTGASADLIGALGNSPAARGGYYSPYIGAFVDVAKIMSSVHTAQYQYIPALALPKQYELNLRLNNPPSFRNPKSVLVVALPEVQAAPTPPLRAVDPAQVFCLQKAPLVLPAEGAPLVFSTELAHGMTLHLQNQSGHDVDLPATADAARGGFVVDTHALQAADFDPAIKGTLRGYWGFDPYVGPSFHLRSAHAMSWTVPAADKSALIVGRQDTIHLESEDACCVDNVVFKDQFGKQLKTNWKLSKPGEVEVKVPLEEVTAGPGTVLVKQFGLSAPDEVVVYTYSEAAHLDRFTVNAGDLEGVLRGTRLDEVASLELKDIQFAPAGLTRVEQKDELRLSTWSAAAGALRSHETLTARVSLKDGRVLDLPTTIEDPRPKVSLISKNIQPGPSTVYTIHLGNPDDLPQDGRLFFLLKSEVPATFPRSEKIEVATADDSFQLLLSTAEGNLIPQNSETVLAVLEPLKNCGLSTFGPLRFRPVDANGKKGDWQPLVNLVRLPTLREISCPEDSSQPCALTGSNLFLIESLATDEQFTQPVTVPLGFFDTTLNVPRVSNGMPLYFKLRDDPSAINSATLLVSKQPQ